MGLAISGLNAVETPATSDVLEVEQSTGSAKATIQQIDDLAFNDTIDLDATILPIEGDLATYDGAAWEPNTEPRWRVIPSDAWSPSNFTSSSADKTHTITFNGGEVTDNVYLKASDYCETGVAVKVVTTAGTYYGVCIGVSDTELVLYTSWVQGTITSISVGTKDMVVCLTLTADGTGYDGGGVTYVAKGCQHVWRGSTGYVCRMAFAHMTTASNLPSLMLCVGSNPVTLSDTATEIPAGASGTVYGAWVNGYWVDRAEADVSDSNILRIYVSVAGGTPSDYLICSIMLVVP